MKTRQNSPLLLLIASLLVGFITSCSEPTETDLANRAAEGDLIWLADIDATGSRVQYKLKQAVTTNAFSGRLRVGMQYAGPKVEVGTDYGQEALLFFSGSSKPSFDLVVVLHDDRTFSGATKEDLIRRLQNARKR